MNAPVPTANPAPSAPASLPKPPSTLLVGVPGTGKTHSIATLLEAGLKVFFLGVEPNATDTLLDVVRKKNLPMDNLHWQYIEPANPDIDSLVQMASDIGNKTYEELSNVKSGIAKDKTQQFLQMLRAFKNFKDERTGQDFGSIFKFDDSCAFVIDSLTGVNDMAYLQTVGHKPAPAKGEWGVAMKLELDTIKMLCSALHCFFVLTAHMDKEVNEATGATQLTSSALGSKNAGKIMRPFSEIVMTKRGRDGKTFLWSTWETAQVVDLKSRALPIGDNLAPSFRPLVDAHRARVAAAQKESVSVKT